jgi:hypothetical protein
MSGTKERKGRRRRVIESRQDTTSVHQFSGVDLVAVLTKPAKRVLHKNYRTTTDCLFFIIQGIFFFF